MKAAGLLALGVLCISTAQIGCGSSSNSEAGSAGAGSAGTSGTGAGGAGTSSAGANNAGMSGANGGAGGANGGQGAVAGAGGVATAMTACAEFAAARCEHIRDCLSITFGLSYASLADCEATTAQACAVEAASPGTSRNADRFSACAKATVPQTCAEWLSAAPAACTMPGTQADGAGCEFNSQCASTYCAVTYPNWCGVCQERVAAGQPCTYSDQSCAAGLICNDVCITPKLESQPCVSSLECPRDLRCIAGACSKPKAVGAGCQADNCDFDAICSATGAGSSCIKPHFVGVGGTCDATNFCDGSSNCLDSTGMNANTGTCTASAAPGASCKILGCSGHTSCINDVCVAQPAAATCP